MQNTSTDSDDLLTIFEIIQKIQSQADLHGALTEIITETSNLIPESVSSFYLTGAIFRLYENSNKLPMLEKGNSIKVYNMDVVGSQILHQDLILKTHDSRKPFTSLERDNLGKPIQSVVTVPLIRNERSYGVFIVDFSISSSSPTEFSEKSLLLICLCLAITASNIIKEHQDRSQTMAVDGEQDTLLMSLAHEINTPLIGILADSENLSQELINHPELQQVAKNNLEQVSRLQLLTETIMGILTKEKIGHRFQVVNVYEPLREACELFSAEASFKGCDILSPKHIGDVNFPEIEMSRFDLEIALKNIVHNAVKYSFKPSSGNQGTRRYINVWGQWADSTRKYYKISVQNYGVGISRQEIDDRLIFKSYYRGINASDRRRTGAGFGLAYAKQVVEDIHGGKINVESAKQGGDGYLTTFTITLPVKQEYRFSNSNVL